MNMREKKNGQILLIPHGHSK